VPKPLAVVPELENELDVLYALAPAEFTAARNDLAKRLKQAGQDEAAAQVKGLRKPTVPLWAVNQLARRDPKGIEALIAAAEQLRTAQEDALRGGESTPLRKATNDERRIVRELTQLGDDLLRESGHGSAGERIAATLRAAALAPEGRKLLRQGRLTEELESSGFGALAGIQIPATKAKAKPKTPTPAQRRRREERQRKLRERAEKLRQEAKSATREVTQAEAALERARKQAERAVEAAARAEAELETLNSEE
jgi:hypothetical protein